MVRQNSQSYDRRLVRAALDLVAGMSVIDAAALLNVSHQTISIWRRHKWKRLSEQLRSRLEEALRKAGKPLPELPRVNTRGAAATREPLTVVDQLWDLIQSKRAYD